MNHLLRPQLFTNLFLRKRILPFRCFCNTIPSPDLSLKRRIEQAPDSTVSIIPLLHQWSQFEKRTTLSELRRIITSLHSLNRFSHALQISEWMSEQKVYNLYPSDFETLLLLIAKVHGLQAAEKFLDTIPVEKKGFYVHNALLNCCKAQSSLSIAESTFQKMREFGLLTQTQTQPYNTMLSLYHAAGNHDMVVNLLREMDSYDMVPQGVRFSQLLSSYSMSSPYDIQGMDKFLSKWEMMVECPWAVCYFPGLVYCASGFKEKGLALLRRTEPLLAEAACKEKLYGCLIAMYCHAGAREDVYRLWNFCKDFLSFESFGCSEIIKTFTEKGDLDGAYEVLEEWDTGGGDLDLADFGLRKRYVKEEAERVVNMLGKKESKWESLTQKLEKSLVEDEEDKEEERMKKVTKAMEGEGMLHNRWSPKGSLALSAYTCVQYAEGRRDIESAADILRQLSKREQVSHAMDKNRLGLKMVEAMVGGGYVGGGED
ncbi:hypothetical protein AALP_AA3G373900 [Arabis alpina]|uniref:Pentacotripeptide-repeat region of PRORP domain-containing protein n=1 Tax=Arabis alpina TaxID=50452 RepID=A0A087HE92_ARAAL|nr:hypothetical protein AALP_AA3G373900 [Arabis alpina]